MASYTKLKSGEWGIRVQGAAKQWQTVSVTTKAGKNKTETVTKVIWSGNGVTLCAIQSRETAGASRSSSRGSLRGKWTGCACGSREDEPRDSDCTSCRFENFDQ